MGIIARRAALAAVLALTAFGAARPAAAGVVTWQFVEFSGPRHGPTSPRRKNPRMSEEHP